MPAKLKPSNFYARIKKADGSECIEWQGSLHQDGYGHLTYQSKYWLAHRLAWTLANGQIPDGDCVCHTCDNRRCCNVDHMFLGSHSDNMADMRNKGRRKGINAGEKNGRAKLTAEKAKEIRAKYAKKQRQVDLAREYGVAQAVISLIVRGSIWKDA